MKRKWTQESATKHILKVQAKKLPWGLTLCSACDYLRLDMKLLKKPNSR